MQHSLAFDTASNAVAPLPKVDYDYPEDRKDWNGIALIGEAPGAEEVRRGHPFVGRSGQLLDKMLAEAGIDRRRCFIGNVFRFQPPGNKVDHFFISKRAAVAQNMPIATQFGSFGSVWCRSYYVSEINNLKDVLHQLKPHIIVALGRTPTWALTGMNGLLDKVGSLFPCRLVAGVEVIPTYHPSFILRGNWNLQEKWLTHFLAVQKKTL